MSSEIDHALGEFHILQDQLPTEETMVVHVAELPSTTEKDQFTLLSSVSNFHWMSLPSVKHAKHLTNETHIAYVQHMLFDVNASTSSEGYARKYIPPSPRNRLMYLICSEESEGATYQLLRHLHSKDNGNNGDPNEIEDNLQPPLKKRRKHTRKLVAVTERAVYECIGEGLSSQLNSANPRRGIFADFREQLITEGMIRWRMHDEEKDICVMNDYHPAHGTLLPNNFVHVTCYRDQDEGPILKCTCAIFGVILRCAHQGIDLNENEEILPDSDFTCMHCRFYKEYLLDAWAKVFQGTFELTKPQEMVKNSLQYMDKPILLIGSVFPFATTKFSVQGEKGDDEYASIHISFPDNRCRAKCLNGMCAAGMRNKKRIPKAVSILDKSKLCSHLGTIADQLDYFKSYFPEHFTHEEVGEGDENDIEEDEYHPLLPPPGEIANVDDVNLKPERPVVFNYETGLWDFPALSKHTPLEEEDVTLIFATQKRNRFAMSTDINTNSGIYDGGSVQDFNLVPKLANLDGSTRICGCGIPYTSDKARIEFTTNLFTRNGVIACKCYNYHCENDTCFISYKDAAMEQGIFLYTKFTAMGDEMGYDFISLVLKGRLSCTAYCNEITRRYKTNNLSSRGFLSPNTFISWFFGWLSAFKIDFRKEVDPWCKYKPKILACDGTHIGVSLRNLKLTNPVTQHDTQEIKTPKHKRNDRVIIKDRHARGHLRYLCQKLMGLLKPKEILEEEEEDRRTLEFIRHVTTKCEPKLAVFFNSFAQKLYNDKMLKSMGKLLYLLSGDASMSTVAPFPAHEVILNACADALANRRNMRGTNNLKHWALEIADLLMLGQEHNCTELITDFCEELINKVKDVHKADDPKPQVRRKPGTYDPRSGTAYYFTEHGDQLRDLPQYDVCASSLKNHDDIPGVDRPCRKLFPEVSFGGFGYLFLWFCPIHGHSYGFHMIAGSEGRKDPFASLYKYCEEMPEHVFYDFACQLSEYCLNREPELFKNTRFWHDLFHLIGHLCGYNFKSGRITGLTALNTQICEQWNSFLQSVKYTASHFSQDHFAFFLQYFLFRTNREKTKSFRMLGVTAVAGTL